MKALTIVADDAGVDASVDAAILASARAGVVRAASVLVRGPTAATFVAAARKMDLALGLHLCLTEGKALSAPLVGLTNENGAFPPAKDAFVDAECRVAESPRWLEDEVAAQWRALAALGAEASFANGHGHVHAIPCVARALANVLRRAGVADAVWVRRPWTASAELPPDLRHLADARLHRATEAAWQGLRGPDAFVGMRFARAATLAEIEAELDAVPAEAAWIEWMVHPGTRPGSTFTTAAARTHEAALLCNERQLPDWLGRRGLACTARAGVAERP